MGEAIIKNIELVEYVDVPVVHAEGVFQHHIVGDRIHLLLYAARVGRQGIEYYPVQELVLPIDWTANNIMPIAKSIAEAGGQKTKMLS